MDGIRTVGNSDGKEPHGWHTISGNEWIGGEVEQKGIYTQHTEGSY